MPCELCDYKAKSASNFKEHIEVAHGIKLNGALKQRTERGNTARVEGFGMANDSFNTVFHKDNRKKKGFCVWWNRGHCHYDDNTFFMNIRTFQHADFKKGAVDQIASFIMKQIWGNFLF